MTQPSEIQIFLAYADKDESKVQEIYQRLKEVGYKPWWKKDDILPGEKIPDAISQAIKNSHLFIACLSSTSVEEPGYIQKQFRQAVDLMAERPVGDIYLIPLKLEECEIPDLRQNEYGVKFQELQPVNYWEGGAWDKLLQAIEYQTGVPANPKSPSDIPDKENKSISIEPRQEFSNLIENIELGTIIPFIGAGVNSEFYLRFSSKVIELIASKKREELLKSATVEEKKIWQFSSPEQKEFFNMLIQRLIALPCSVCHYFPEYRPRDNASKCSLCPAIDKIKEGSPEYKDQELVIAKMNLRRFSQYIEVKEQSELFYNYFRKIFKEIQEEIEAIKENSKVYEFLVSMTNLKSPPHVIVTTNYDSRLEKAFGKQPYDLVFYVADEGYFKHSKYPHEDEPVCIENPDEYSKSEFPFPDNKNDKKYRPVILKLYGTLDESTDQPFALREDQLIDLAYNLFKRLPVGLKTTIENKNLLFLGYSPNDYDLDFILDHLLRKKCKKSWLIHQSSFGEIEKSIWKESDLKINSIQLKEIKESFIKSSLLEEFVAALNEKIQVKV